MIIPDANLLLYAYSERSPSQPAARAWLEMAFSSGEAVGLPWSVIQAFLRIGTNSRAMTAPLTMDEAVATVSEWLALDQVAPVLPGERHWTILSGLLDTAQCRGPLVADAHLAALAIEHGAQFYTADRGFARFPGLRWTDPLRPA